MLAEGRYKYVRNLIEDEIEELYDLDRDPEELENLALQSSHSNRLKSYRARTVKELHRTQAPFWANMPKSSTMR